MPKLALVQRRIQCLRSRSVSKPRLPITPDILRQLKALWTGQATDFNIIMLWAACCTAFFAFLRMGELKSPTVTNQGLVDCVSVGDVAVDATHLWQGSTCASQKQISWGREWIFTCIWAGLTKICAQWQPCWPIWLFEGKSLAPCSD